MGQDQSDSAEFGSRETPESTNQDGPRGADLLIPRAIPKIARKIGKPYIGRRNSIPASPNPLGARSLNLPVTR